MTSASQIVNIAISQASVTVPQESFSQALVLGPTGFGNSDIIRSYATPKSMLSDGFTTSSPEYIYANELMSQALAAPLFYVGKRTTPVSQIDTLSVNTLTSSHLYSFTLNGTVISYTSQSSGDTQQSILTALLAAIATAFPSNDPVTGVVSGSGSGASLALTAASPGAGFSISAVGSELTLVSTTANNGIVTDIQAIQNVAIIGDAWYGLALCSNVDYDILQTAAYIESIKKVFIGVSADSAIATSSTTDLASQLQGKAYTRTALIYTPTSAALGIEAAWLGGQLPQNPGASTWKFKQGVGISPDSFTQSVRSILIGQAGVSNGKGVNIYESVGGVNIFEEGWMVGGQFIDITVGIDWLESTMQNAVFTQLVSNPKIPYTDKGIVAVENVVRQVLKQASDDNGNGLLDSTTIVVTAVKAASIPQSSKNARVLPAGSITFSATFTGAFHFININGVVSL